MPYPSLSEIVLETIDLYSSRTDLPGIDLIQFHTPLVVGSGNGYYTGRIIFRNTPAYFCLESEVETKLENIPSITDIVVVSASGEKHAPIILEAAKHHGKNTFLISSSEVSTGRSIADGSIIMPKIREPYTYNTSTYFGYMLAETPDINLMKLREFLTGELSHALSFRTEGNEVIASIPLVGRIPDQDDTSLLSFSEGESDSVIPATKVNWTKVQESVPCGKAGIFTDVERFRDKPGMTKPLDFSLFSSFFLVIPDQFVLLREMFEVKFIELFGRKVARDIFSYEQMKHATTVVQDNGELFICFGNTSGVKYGENQINLPLFSEDSQKQEIRGRENFSQGAYQGVSEQEKSFSDKEVRSFSESSSSYAAMMLIGYYVIGKIQESLPQYFDESIDDYCIRAKALSGFNIKPWVEV